MDSDAGDERVSTTVPEPVYERLERIADREDQSLAETLRIAARAYVQDRSEHDPDDPFFAYEPEGTTDERLSATDVDTYLYGRE